MAIGIAILVLIVVLAMGFVLTTNQSSKRKLIVWGLVLMFGISPFFSWLIGIGYGVYVGAGFAGAGLMIILFGVIFLIGFITLLVGLFKKGSHKKIHEL